ERSADEPRLGTLAQAPVCRDRARVQLQAGRRTGLRQGRPYIGRRDVLCSPRCSTAHKPRSMTPALTYTRAGEAVTSLEPHKGLIRGNLRRLNSRRRKTKRKKLRERDGDHC